MIMNRRAKVAKVIKALKQTHKNEPGLFDLPYTSAEKNDLAAYYDWTWVLTTFKPRASPVCAAALVESLESLHSFLHSRRSRVEALK